MMIGPNSNKTNRPQSIHELEDQLEELTFFQRLDRELTWILDVNHVIDITLDWALRRTAADAALMVKREDDLLVVTRVLGADDQKIERLMREPWPITTGFISTCVTENKSSLIEDVEAIDPSLTPLIDENNKSIMAVPLALREHVLAVVYLEGAERNQFTADMLEFMETMSGRSALALQNADMYARTHHAEQLKSDMIRMASHDLRNPLTTITNALSLVKRMQKDLPELVQVGFKTIDQATNQMQMLIEELLTLERLESGVEMDIKPVNLHHVLNEAMERMEDARTRKQHEIKINSTIEPLFTHGEGAFYRQAMINLISNAIKYTPEGGEIVVRLEKHGSRIFFDVKDNGYGIAQENQKRLFQRFYRAKEATTSHITGTGLGLSLVKAIIERSKGEVWFQSELGQGSTFGFWLPASEESILDEFDTLPSPPTMLTQVLKRRRIREARHQSFQ